ncbi:MAG: ATP-binding cassette domain-containing protein [Polyangiaceae bacterium]
MARLEFWHLWSAVRCTASHDGLFLIPVVGRVFRAGGAHESFGDPRSRFCTFRCLPALQWAVVVLERGFTALVGENGSGKTTLLELVAGEREPDTGSIRFEPRDAKLCFVRQRIEVASAAMSDFSPRPGAARPCACATPWPSTGRSSGAGPPSHRGAHALADRCGARAEPGRALARRADQSPRRGRARALGRRADAVRRHRPARVARSRAPRALDDAHSCASRRAAPSRTSRARIERPRASGSVRARSGCASGSSGLAGSGSRARGRISPSASGRAPSARVRAGLG